LIEPVPPFLFVEIKKENNLFKKIKANQDYTGEDTDN
jgi:hypothetical protein